MNTPSQQHPFNPERLSISPDAIIAHSHELLLQQQPLTDDMFITKPVTQWMEEAKNRPPQQMLFASFWFDGEICMLFADTNLGKSILAVQIGNSISSGKPMEGVALETPAQPVLYFDFELTDRQFESRYSIDGKNHYQFHPNFYRVEINPEVVLPDGVPFENHLTDCLERVVIEKQARILIIDNLTYLRNETEKAKDALPLMKQLKALKNKYNLSILVLAHTPKRDQSKPITRNDLSGSKMLINFCDSAVAIGESSKDSNLRYLKQIKQRNTDQRYGADNVPVCQIIKHYNFLQFEIIGFSHENEHLREQSDKANNELLQKVKTLRDEGESVRNIGITLGISKSMVERLIKKLV